MALYRYFNKNSQAKCHNKK